MDPETMLTLAAIAYRGCELNLSDPHGRGAAYDEMKRCLRTFSRVKDKWEIVWGPAGFHPGVVGLDDSAMYVARLARTPTLAIVIRGTNPFSLTDWLSNLLIDQRPWPYGNAADSAGAKVSHSIAVGLSILQRLRSDVSARRPNDDHIWNAARRWIVSHEARLGYLLLRVAEHGRSEPDRDLLGRVDEWIRSALTGRLSPVMRGIIHQIDQALTRSSSRIFDETAMIARVERSQKRFDTGVSLIEYIRAFVEQANAPATIYVTGHSKGGALATAVASWLADTGGESAFEHDRWDPNGTSSIQLYSFAAPTSGNSGFARHCADMMPGHYRMANPLDVVPHAWNVDDMDRIPTLYGAEMAIFRGLVDVLLPRLRELDYQHVEPQVAWTEQNLEPVTLAAQILFQHLDAYLTRLGLIGEITTDLLFKPIS